MRYDVAVVGAGPAGLMAATTVAEQGLKVVLVEKGTDVSRITRACCTRFAMDDGYEKEHILFKGGKIIFGRNGFKVDYSGRTHNLTNKYYISPKGHRIHFANKDGSPLAVKSDKGALLQGLWERCEKSRVEMRGGAPLPMA